ncbi:MAG TPA: condensation domain-containing protein, partial [Pseudonocardiaceae bacterium]
MDTRPDPSSASAATVARPLPASSAQERLWFFSQLVPDIAVYNVPCRMEIGVPGQRVDVNAVQAALAVVVARHETLRTRLATRDGQLTQLVHGEVPVQVEYTDLRGLPAAECETRAAEIAAQDAATPIPLDRAPLWRARLIHRADDHCQLVFVVHHAVFDGLSAENFTVELLRGYHALRAGERPDLAELPLQYGDFAAWQRERMATGELDDQMAYWRRALADPPPPLRLPALGAGQYRAGGPHRGGHVMFAVPAPLTRQVRELARSHRTTPYVVLLAGFAILLHRLTGESDLLIGTPVSGRNRPALAASIGMFVNTLVLRADCSGQPGLGDLVDRMRGTVMDALDNQDVAYDHVVKVLAPDRDASGSPLHRVVFNLLPGASIDDLDNGTAKVDLLIGVAEQPDAYAGRLEYRGDLFDEPAATALTARLLRLLTAGLADPGTPIGRLPLLDDAERRRVLAATFDAPAAAEPEGVIDLFAARVAARPELTAVVDAAGDRLSYRALDEQSSRLARHLATVAPVGPDARV